LQFEKETREEELDMLLKYRCSLDRTFITPDNMVLHKG
jgi:hypothetical protein